MYNEPFYVFIIQMILYRPLHLEKIECIFFNVLDIFRKEYGQFFDYLKENEKGFFFVIILYKDV